MDTKKGNKKKANTALDATNASILPLKELQHIIDGISNIDDLTIKGIHINAPDGPLNEDVTGGPTEPVYGLKAQNDIQGNVIPGFNKGHQQFLFYTFNKDQKSIKKAKVFLRWISPYIASMGEVLEFRRIYRIRRLRLGKEHVFLCSTWVNIAFSNYAIAKLIDKNTARSFGDQSYRQGMAERSSYLGDPVGEQKGAPSTWPVGGEKNEADMIVIVASDSEHELKEMVEIINQKASSSGLNLIFDQKGTALPGKLHGHEHFGFKDGISQPGIRGRLSSNPGDYITPRYISNTDDRRLYFSKPGELLHWPGQFLLGEPRQSSEHLYNSVPAASNFPKWAARGSYLVVRRLQQDVTAFWEFAYNVSTQLGISKEKAASMLVGRWPSGAPIMRTPNTDNVHLGADQFANNHFLFDDDTQASSLRSIPGYSGDNYPPAMADFLATVCPHFAHIRKINPRDSVTDLGKPEDNLIRSILRRGIPYGPPVMGVKKVSKRLLAKERGLMFLCYGSTIEDQYEFLQRRWANSKVQPNFGGHDPIIGQNGENLDRYREIEITKTDGTKVKIKIKQEWVTPAGGGYFFAPPISAIKNILGT